MTDFNKSRSREFRFAETEWSRIDAMLSENFDVWTNDKVWVEGGRSIIENVVGTVLEYLSNPGALRPDQKIRKLRRVKNLAKDLLYEVTGHRDFNAPGASDPVIKTIMSMPLIHNAISKTSTPMETAFALLRNLAGTRDEIKNLDFSKMNLDELFEFGMERTLDPNFRGVDGVIDAICFIAIKADNAEKWAVAEETMFANLEFNQSHKLSDSRIHVCLAWGINELASIWRMIAQVNKTPFAVEKYTPAKHTYSMFMHLTLNPILKTLEAAEGVSTNWSAVARRINRATHGRQSSG